VPVAHTPHVIN